MLVWLLLLLLLWKPAFFAVKVYYYKEDSYKDDIKNWFMALWHLVSPTKLEAN